MNSIRTIDTVTVLGAGTMGHGIAHVAALSGYSTRLHDVSPEAVEQGLTRIRANLDKGVEKGKVTPEQHAATLDRLRGAPDFDDALAGADLVVEAAPEDLALKQDLFTRIGERVPADALLATNTSSLPVSRIAEGVPGPERFLGMHFFNPVHIMSLLELVRGDVTSEAAVDAALAVGARMGKECIVVRDVPGFATSRLGLALGLEAIRMVEQEVAAPEDIDTAMTLGYRHPVGPLRLTDIVGLDVRLAIAEHLHRSLGSDVFQPPELLRTLVRQGKLGKKSGEGFYRWS